MAISSQSEQLSSVVWRSKRDGGVPALDMIILFGVRMSNDADVDDNNDDGGKQQRKQMQQQHSSAAIKTSALADGVIV